METELVFVYGTLKRGCKNHHVLQRFGAKFVTNAKTTEKLPMYDIGDGFPYLQDSFGKGRIVFGEIWSIPEENVKDLDYFEGTPTLYKRMRSDCQDLGGKLYPKVNHYFKASPLTNEQLEKVTFINEWVEDTWK